MNATGHVRLSEWRTVEPDTGAGHALRGRELGAAETSLVRQLREARALDVEELKRGLRITARSWVGRIQLGDLLVTVEPKLAPAQLMPLIRYAYDLSDLRIFGEGLYAEGGALLQDLLVAQLLAEAESLTKRGLRHNYVATSSELAMPTGRIDFNALQRYQPQVRASLPCHHHLRSIDHLLNQVLFAGLGFSQRIAQSPMLRSAVRQLIGRFQEGVTTIELDGRALKKAEAQLNRLNLTYRPALELIRLLHSCSSISLEDEVSVNLPGFLFDMNRFFQALVGKLLREALSPGALFEEHALTGMMLYVPGANPRRRRAPTPRPDFMVRDGSRKLLLDAKYRDLWETELPREMLYQLAIYALSQPEGATAAILYPTLSPSAEEALVEIREPTRGVGQAWVALRPLQLGELAQALEDEAGGRTRVAELARRLIYGRFWRSSLSAKTV